MKYTIHTGENYIDALTLKRLLQIDPSKLKREIKKYFKPEDFIKYNNKHLYKEDAVIGFIYYLLTENVVKGRKKDSDRNHEI